MHQSGSGAVTALIYHKGLLFSGFSDGSIRVCIILFIKMTRKTNVSQNLTLRMQNNVSGVECE